MRMKSFLSLALVLTAACFVSLTGCEDGVQVGKTGTMTDAEKAAAEKNSKDQEEQGKKMLEMQQAQREKQGM